MTSEAHRVRKIRAPRVASLMQGATERIGNWDVTSYVDSHNTVFYRACHVERSTVQRWFVREED